MTDVSFVTVFVIRPTPAGNWEFLQVFRSPGRYMAQTWQSVSGGIEPAEPAWRAAVREMAEETGLAPRELYALDHVQSFYLPHTESVAHAIPFCAVVAADATVTLNEEHTDYRWLPADGFESAVTWPGQKVGVREVIAEIIGNGPSKPFARIELK